MKRENKIKSTINDLDIKFVILPILSAPLLKLS